MSLCGLCGHWPFPSTSSRWPQRVRFITCTCHWSEFFFRRSCFIQHPTHKGTVIRVHLSCSQGLCDCEHFIGGVCALLLPCRFAAHMFREGHKSRGKDWELFQGVTEGFDIVDHPVNGYDCANYGSITSRPAREVMDISIKEELCEGRVSPVDTKPTCMQP